MSNEIDSDEIGLVIQSYANSLHNFQFDKARESVESFRIKHQHCLDRPQDIAWLALLQGLSQLSQVERSYFGLNFLLPKGYFRKENPIKNNYNQIRTDLHRSADILKSSLTALTEVPDEVVKKESLAEHLLIQFQAYIMARIDLINFYVKLSAITGPKGLGLDEMIAMLREIKEKHKKSFHHPEIDGLRSGFLSEVDILIVLLECQHSVNELQLIPCLTHLKMAHSQLKDWLGNTKLDQKTQGASSWFSLGSSQKQNNQLSLCIWLRSFYESLLSKFTLYFHDALYNATTQQEFKQQLSTFPTAGQIVGKIVNFQKKQEAYCVFIFVDRHENPVFPGIQYRHPDRDPPEPLTGIATCPVIYCQPPNASPDVHQCDWIMLMNTYSNTLTERTAYMYDNKKPMTYYLSFIENHIHLCILFKEKKQEKDSIIVCFINEVISELKFLKLFQALKFGGK